MFSPAYVVAVFLLCLQFCHSNNKMKITTKTLGLLGIAAAPFLFFEMNAFSKNGMADNSMGGVFDLTYMLGWMCTITGLLRTGATGNSKWARSVLYIQLGLLCVANVWNIWTIIDPTSTNAVYRLLDLFWPISNAWMLVTGTMVVIHKKWKGWKRYSVLLAGCWLPTCFILCPALGGYPAVMF